VVLEGMNNPTNVGSVFRAVAGLGFDAVLLDPRCYDPLYRRAVRVSMGAVLSLPWARVAPWPTGLDVLRGLGFVLLALTPARAAVPLAEVAADPPERLALLIGAEGPGLSPQALAATDRAVRIPMAPGLDSLNAAVAAAVACYALGPSSAQLPYTET
jgi:tRNA G18 (ribose-2'-O)-methylase SpoU